MTIQEWHLKNRARAETLRAIKQGLIEQKPCEICGGLPTKIHHLDYSKPFEIQFFCRSHHNKTHTPKERATVPYIPKYLRQPDVSALEQPRIAIPKPAYKLVECLDSVVELAWLMVLVEQFGGLWLAKWLEDRYFSLQRFASVDEAQDAKARLAKELYKLRKRGKLVTPISDRQFNERLTEIYGSGDEDGEAWKQGS